MFTPAVRSAVRAQRANVRGMATISDRFPTKVGGKFTVSLIPGDGIGPEIADSVKEVFDAIKVPIEWDQQNVSGETEGHETKFQDALESLRRNKVGLKGILYTPPDASGHNSWNIALRRNLDLFASVTPCKTIPGIPNKHQNVDLTIIRENTEGEYSGLEHQSVPGVVESLKISTRPAIERIARFAYNYALKNNRKRVAIVHKANIMKLGDGLFMRTCQDIFEREFKSSQLTCTNLIVDNASMQLVSNPQQFDVMVMPNLYGAILSNIGSALVGGPGIVPGATIGQEIAVFEPGCRHVGKDIAGKNVANPSALLLSSTMLLRHLGLEVQANAIASSVYDVLKEGKNLTRDLGGNTSTTDFTKAVINRLQ